MGGLGRLWITRTLPGGIDSAGVWIAAGFTVCLAPILKIADAATPPLCPARGTHLIFTSRNGVAAFARAHDLREFDVICVGDATAAKAKAAGFSRVTVAGGTSAAIVDLVLGQANPATHYTHCSGKHVRGTITESLVKAGLSASRSIYYGSAPLTDWTHLSLDEISHVALYSPLAAETFAQHVIGKDAGHLTTISISAATDAALKDLDLQNRYIAQAPTESAMLSLF